jgi:hypothetical protein
LSGAKPNIFLARILSSLFVTTAKYIPPLVQHEGEKERVQTFDGQPAALPGSVFYGFGDYRIKRIRIQPLPAL